MAYHAVDLRNQRTTIMETYFPSSMQSQKSEKLHVVSHIYIYIMFFWEHISPDTMKSCYHIYFFFGLLYLNMHYLV